MRYKIVHTTSYAYSEAVPVCHNAVHLAPRTYGKQVCVDHRLLIHPAPPQVLRRVDYFGNDVHYFSIHEPHRKLTVTSTSLVDVNGPSAVPSGPAPGGARGTFESGWDALVQQFRNDRSPAALDAYQFLFPSPMIEHFPELRAYAAESFWPGRPLSEAACDLMERIHRDFVYDPKATTVSTPVDKVFRRKRGVCQDFAHVTVGCLRSQGIPARYVSGYLRTNPPAGRARLVGADASHAWLSVYLGGKSWLDLDPTNNVVPGENHVTLAWGRDYGDVCPVQGVFVGGGDHAMQVSVDVAAQDQQ